MGIADELRYLARTIEPGKLTPITEEMLRDVADRIESEATRGTCRRVYHPRRTRASGPQYTCSACGYGASDDRWRYCPKCGSEYGNTMREAREEEGYE